MSGQLLSGAFAGHPHFLDCLVVAAGCGHGYALVEDFYRARRLAAGGQCLAMQFPSGGIVWIVLHGRGQVFCRSLRRIFLQQDFAQGKTQQRVIAPGGEHGFKFFFHRYYCRQKVGVKITSRVNISSLPMIMARLRIHFDRIGKPAKSVLARASPTPMLLMQAATAEKALTSSTPFASRQRNMITNTAT